MTATTTAAAEATIDDLLACLEHDLARLLQARRDRDTSGMALHIQVLAGNAVLANARLAGIRDTYEG